MSREAILSFGLKYALDF